MDTDNITSNTISNEFILTNIENIKASVSPEELRPYPKAKERKKNTNRGKIKTEILTSTPVKQMLEKEQKKKK